MVEKVAPGQVSRRVLGFSAAGIIPPILHANLHINTALENCALLGYYAANSGNSLPTFRDNLSVPSLARRVHFSFTSRRKPEITILLINHTFLIARKEGEALGTFKALRFRISVRRKIKVLSHCIIFNFALKGSNPT
jgi:hypothetical protein